MQSSKVHFKQIVFCMWLCNVGKGNGTLFAVPVDDVFFNISFKSVPQPNTFIAVQKHPDNGNKVMVFLDRISPPEIAGAYRGRINYTGNIGRSEMTFWLYNVSIEDAGEFRVVSIGSRKVFGSQILAVAGRPDNPTIIERTIPQVNKDHDLECKTHSNSRPEQNGFQMSFIWKRNGMVLANNSDYTVKGQILTIRNLHREAWIDKYTCVAYDSLILLSNESNYYRIDPKYGPSKELTLDPSNRTYFAEEGFEMRNITCSADCHPDCIYTWDRGVGDGAKLYMGILDGDKDGIYRCTARNPITNVSWTTALEVILTTGNNCSCLLGTCKVEICSSSSAITPAHTAESGHISCTDESCLNGHDYYFECPVAKEPISFIGYRTHSVNFMWDCSLLPNESVLGVMWFKENAFIAKAINSTFTPCGSYIGRLERFGTFGISLHNISVNDSGHYKTSVLLNYILTDNRATDTACRTAYLPALPEELWESVKDDDSSLRDQQGPSKLEIGLICGFVLMTILGLGVVLCFYRKRRKTNQRENESMSPEQTQML